MEELIKTISEYKTINNSDIKIINEIFSKDIYKKGEFLIEQGKRADKIFFIKKGLVRMYFINESGNEINTYFASDGNFITSFSSFINQHLSVEYLKAEKETVAYSINYSDFIINNDFLIKFRTLF